MLHCIHAFFVYRAIQLFSLSLLRPVAHPDRVGLLIHSGNPTLKVVRRLILIGARVDYGTENGINILEINSLIAHTLRLNEVVVSMCSIFPAAQSGFQAGHSLDFCGRSTGQSPERGSLIRFARGFLASVFIYLFFFLSVPAARPALHDGRGNLLGCLDLFLFAYIHTRDLVN